MTSFTRIFISAATREYGEFRRALAATLHKHGYNVEEQLDFANSPDATPLKMARMIRHAPLVIHIAGYHPGAVPGRREVENLFDEDNPGHIPKDAFFATFPGLREEDLLAFTYTQLEALVAVHYRRDIIVYAPASARSADGKIADDFPQKRHLELLEHGHVGRPCMPVFFPDQQDPHDPKGQHALQTMVTADASRRRNDLLPPHERPRPETRYSDFFIPGTGDFIGRKTELAEILRLVCQHHLVCLVGPGGSGKTWLANQVVYLAENEFPDGSWVAELAGLDASDTTEEPLKSDLDIRLEAHVKKELHLSAEEAKLSLVEYLHDRQALLVLDNCEHLKEACGRLIMNLAGCKKLRILTTSTVDLCLGRAKYRHVAPMGLPPPGETRKEEVAKADAVQLLLSLAHGRGLMLTDENAGIVARICHLLEGMPLALKIVAYKCGGSSVSLLKNIAASMEEIIYSAEDPHECLRHRRIAAVIEWGFRLLSAKQKALLPLLSGFRDGFSTPAAWQVCGAHAGGISRIELEEIMTELVERSMVEARDLPLEEDETGRRHRLLEPIRLFCARLLQADPTLIRALAENHRDWCVQFLQQRARVMENGGGNQVAAAKQIALEHDNLRSAMNWCCNHKDSANGLRLAVGIWRFWEVRGFYEDGRKEIEALIAANPAGENEKLVAEAHTAVGMLAYRQANYAVAEPAYLKALAMEEDFPERNRLRICMCRSDIANFYSMTGRLEEALKMHWESLEEAIALNSKRQMAISRNNWASIALGLGHLHQADMIEDFLVKSENGFRDEGCTTDMGYPMGHQGWLAFYRGRFAAAVGHFQRVYENRVKINSIPGKFQAREGFVWAQVYNGDLDGARASLLECLELRPVIKSIRVDAQALECAALFLLRTGRTEQALMCLGASTRLRECIGSPRAKHYAAEVARWEAEARQLLPEAEEAVAFQTGRSEELSILFRKVEGWLAE